jgi:hypothetical protein
MDLLDDNRSLIHTGKFLRQPETGFEWSGWSEYFVLLFDNYRKLYLTIFSSVISSILASRHDETEGEGWCHKIPCQSQSRAIFWEVVCNITNQLLPIF